jgi:PAS domain S-box-containing protein
MSDRLDYRLEAFLDALDEAVLLVDGRSPDGTQIIGGNARATALLGYSREELASCSLVDLRVPGDEARASSTYETRRVTGRFSGAVGVRRKDGSAFEAQVTSVSLTSTDGQGLVAIVIRDLTNERRLAEATQALRESEERFRALSDAAFEVVVVHAEGVILSVNRAAEVMFGVPPGQMAGRQLFDFIAPESQPLVLERIRSGDERPYEAVARRADGSFFPVEAQARTAPVRLSNRPARVVAIRDVSQRVALEEQVRQAQKMEAVGRLAGGVAHDFNNILSVIIGAASSALERLGRGHPAAEELVDVLEAADRAAALTRQLLAFGRKQRLDPRVVELDGAVR